MSRKAIYAICILILATYGMAIFLGLRHFHPADWPGNGEPLPVSLLRSPSMESIPQGALGDSIWYGLKLFNETSVYAPAYTGSRLSCSSCHIEGGTAPHAVPVAGVPALFPMFSKRAGHMISLKDRIQECFTRSENGQPLPENGREMTALVDYMHWLSEEQSARKGVIGRGLIKLPDMEPDTGNGQQIYAQQCAGCHGVNGEGSPPLMPPVWGDKSFNDGAGMNRVEEMASFVQYNMPQNRRGILSVQAAYDVSAYIHQMPRPKFNTAYGQY